MPFASNSAAITMLGPSKNPFLSTGDGGSSVTKCIVPNCQESTVDTFPACALHLGPVPQKRSKILDNQHQTNAVHSIGRLPETLSAQSRKQLDAKVTARKTAARLPIIAPATTNGAKTNRGSLSPVNRMKSNGSYPSLIPSLPEKAGRPSPETPSRKRQRISSPKFDDVSPRFARTVLPTRELSASNGKDGFFQRQDHESSTPTQAAGSLLLSRDDEQASRSPSPPSIASWNDTYLVASPSTTPNADELRELKRVDQSLLISPTPPEFNKLQRHGPTPTNPKKRERVAKSPYAGLRIFTRTPPLEKQRRRLAETLDSSALDSFIYGQEASSEPPLGVEKPPEQQTKKRQDVYYGNIDPRIHWTRPHTDEWYRMKGEEIKARGGRKANFGKAAQRMREQRLKEDPGAWEEDLPDRVRNNEQWLGALRWVHSQEQGSQPSETPQAIGPVSPPVRKKRPYRRRNQAAVLEAGARPDASGRLSSDLSNSGTKKRQATVTKGMTKAQEDAHNHWLRGLCE